MMNHFRRFVNYWKENGKKYAFRKAFDFVLNNLKIKNRLVNNNPVITGIVKEKALYGPELVQLDITNNCNNSCVGCWLHSPMLGEKKLEGEDKKQHISTQKILNTISDLKALKTQTILLSGGGEPFIHPDIKKVVEHIRKNGLREIIITNFNLVSKKDIDKMVELKVNELLISLWAATPETYVKTHPNQTEKSFRKVVENIEYLMKKIRDRNVPKVRLLNVINNRNYHELSDMIMLGEKLKVPEIEFTLIDTIKGKTDSLLLSEQQRKELQKQIDSYKANNRTEVFGLDRFKTRLKDKKMEKGYYDEKLVDSIPCYAGFSYARIMADGRVIPCCKAAKHPLGNINEKSFKEIWFSENYEKFRFMAKNEKKSHPYFKKINCYKGCDNYIENKRIHETIVNLSGRKR